MLTLLELHKKSLFKLFKIQRGLRIPQLYVKPASAVVTLFFCTTVFAQRVSTRHSKGTKFTTSNVVNEGTSAPTSPTPIQGDVWYDTTDGLIKIWDGNIWKSVAATSIITNGATVNNTLRWNGTAWVESAVLTNDGTDVTTTGDISVGTDLIVDGAAYNSEAFDGGAGTTIDFAQSNFAYTTASAGAFTLNNLKNGGCLYTCS